MRLIDADKIIYTWTVDADGEEHDGVTLQSIIHKMPTIDAVEVVRCKDCKYFEYDHVENVDGIPLIVAHEICTRWSDGVKTSENGYCFLGERGDSDDES